MSYIAIKNFSTQGKDFKIGDTVPVEFVEDRLIRAKKIGETESIKEEILIETVPAKIEEPKEELLIEDSSNVEVKVEVPEVKSSKKSKK